MRYVNQVNGDSSMMCGRKSDKFILFSFNISWDSS